jgi:hypothetical protein
LIAEHRKKLVYFIIFEAKKVFKYFNFSLKVETLNTFFDSKDEDEKSFSIISEKKE